MTTALKCPRSIFLEAVEQAPHAWPAFLDAACGGDDRLRGQVERLLDAHGRLAGFMAHPAAPAATSDLPPGELVGQTIGRYKLLEQIGEGGMGVVYVAEQTEPVRRQVALKIIKPGMDSRQVIARFEAERQALALMDHPNIARILDAGTTDRRASVLACSPGTSEDAYATGRPYFVMELVRGLPITEYCDQARLTPRQRLELFIIVCQAVQHAHQKGIIHRDLKPSNVLVTLHDGTPVVKAIDFGVAKALSPLPLGAGQGEGATVVRLTEKTLYTGFAQLIGTPLYMSPEQAELSALDIDTRSDVYSLGVLLYELLTGRTPFDADSLKNAGFDEMRRIIREDEPPRPSARLSTLGAPQISTISERRGLDRRRLVQKLRGELDWIVMKALEKDRNRRYESASALAADVERYLDNLPIRARPASLVTRALKWRRRNPVAFLAGIAGILVVAGAVSAVLWHSHRLEKALATSERYLRELREEQYPEDMQEAERAWQDDDRDLLRRLLSRYEPHGKEPDLRGFEWHYLRRMVDRIQLGFVLGRHEAEVAGLDISPNGRFVASGDHSGGLCFWDVQTRQRIKSVQFGDIEMLSVRFSPDGKWLATGGTDKIVRIWTVPNWQLATTLIQHDGSIQGLTWSPDGRQLASASRGDGLACIWNVSDWSLIHKLPHAGELSNAAWSPQGSQLATLERDLGIHLWDTATWTDRGMLECTDPGEALMGLAFSPDGSLVAAGGLGWSLRIFDVASHKLLAHSRSGEVWSLVFDAHDQLIQGGDHFVRSWAVDRKRKTLSGGPVIHTGAANHRSIALATNGQLLVSAGADPTQVAIRDVAGPVGFRTSVCPSLVLPRRGRVIANDGAKRIAAAPIGSPTALARIDYPCLKAYAAPIASPDESLLAVVDSTGVLRVHDTTTWEVRHELPPPAGGCFQYVAFSPDGQWIAAGFAPGGRYGVWNLATGQWRQLSQSPDTEVERGMVAFSPRGMLACAVWGKSQVAVWDVATNKQVGTVSVPMNVGHVLFVADDTVAVGDLAGWISFKNATTGLESARFQAHEDSIQWLALSADGRTLASTGADYAVRLWSVQKRRELFTLWQSSERVRYLTFQPNGDLTFTTESRKTQWIFPGPTP